MRKLLSVACAAIWAMLASCAVAYSAETQDKLTAFHVPWDPQSRISLQSHVDQISVLSSQSVLLTSERGTLTVLPDDDTDTYLKNAGSALKQMPLIANVYNGVWDGKAAAGIITRATLRAGFIADILRLARERHYQGYILDFENLPDAAVAQLPGFIRAVRKPLHAAGLDLWVTVPVGPEVWPLEKMQKAGAGIVFMAYDQCWDSSTPGPVAGADWLQKILPARLRGLKLSRTTVALAGYGYDWPQGGTGHSVTIAEALALARKHEAVLSRGLGSGNVTFRYVESGVPHTVWFVDAYSFRQARVLVRKMGVSRLALWRLGSEDPAMWSAAQGADNLPVSSPPPACEPLDERN